MANLETLSLGDREEGITSGITEAGIRALVAATQFQRLRHLGLCGNWIEERGAEILAGAKHLPALKSIDLIGCGIEERGLLALLNSPTLTSLQELSLEIQDIDADIAEAVVDSPGAKRLRKLTLYVWPDDDLPGDMGRELFSALFEDEVAEILEQGLGERVEFEVLGWTE